ncbi:MAG: hypothetical protein LBT47_01180 [Deltaproteobacteria bacterium]|jgi:hypothetical protein|nr:hypothetical protein [Deltaproteobacteria bacterium]
MTINERMYLLYRCKEVIERVEARRPGGEDLKTLREYVLALIEDIDLEAANR